MRIYADSWPDYQLIDAGNEKKIERWGEVVTIRPDRNAYFKPVLAKKDWYSQAHFEFHEESKKWEQLKPGAAIKDHWQIQFKDLTFQLQLTKFKHLGLFPEQRLNWDFIRKSLQEGDRFLNLFGYTGASSLVARSVGADVFHCDSVRQVINWGKDSMESSGLSDIHWVLEDALKFAQREVKRGRTYKGIIMDPPAFGIGAKGQRWKIENKIEELLDVSAALSEDTGFIILNTYSPRLDELKISEICSKYFKDRNVLVDTLCIKTKTGKCLEYGQRTLIQ